MARALWTGALSFGLVNIPVEVHTAVRESRPRFRMLHAKDRSPINFERVCQKEGETVAWEDLVKGFEYEKGRFVVLTKEDFTAAALEKPRRIDIVDFVKAEAIDDRFFDKPYYLTPGSPMLAATAPRVLTMLPPLLRQLDATVMPGVGENFAFTEVRQQLAPAHVQSQTAESRSDGTWHL